MDFRWAAGQRFWVDGLQDEVVLTFIISAHIMASTWKPRIGCDFRDQMVESGLYEQEVLSQSYHFNPMHHLELPSIQKMEELNFEIGILFQLFSCYYGLAKMAQVLGNPMGNQL